MKRFVLASLMVCLFAAPALAIQVGQLPAPASNGISQTDQPRGHNDDRTPESYGEDNPTAPVPEPGTMALAALSALAFGAAARKRRTKNQIDQ